MSMIGKTLGHYKIGDQPLGKGGMGEVYRAKDLNLGRDVAIKVLPEEFARDADRVARFQREAKLLASLNHPNIAAIHGLEESGGTNFLVLELVEGETLADQIKRGPISVEDSLKIALQIAEALEAAHEKGVIHRDLKPANIKVTPDGKVKVLDFGLAKAYAGDKEDVNLSNSPTLSDAATQQGVILGTAAYMSPEQARGKAVDRKADIWAFGCVLFEMLTGRAVFSGKDVTDILAAVIRAEPDWNSLPENLHWRLRELIGRCLEKDSKDRYHDISDVRVDIKKVLTDPGSVLMAPSTTAEPPARLRTIIPWLAAVVIVGVIAGVAVWKLKPSEPRQVMRFDYELPADQQLSSVGSLILAVSPDGRQFVFATPKGLYLRSVNELTAKLVPGTEGDTQQPFFSPDSQWIGYWSNADRALKKIAISGGAPVTLCVVQQLAGASWNSDNSIVYGQLPGDIMRISSNGGTPQSLVKANSRVLATPQILPDGKTVLFTQGPTPLKIAVQSLQSGVCRELFAGDTARCLTTGHIVYRLSNNTNIFAVPFDLDKLEVKDGPVPVIENVSGFAVSDAGTLVYIPQPTITPPQGIGSSLRTLVWVDRKGKEEPLSAQPKEYRYPKISPDGTKVAVNISTGESSDIWVWDPVRTTMTRLTFEKGYNITPLWTPDGKRIAFCSLVLDQSGNVSGIFSKAADGTGQNERLSTSTDRMLLPNCLSSDGKYLVGAETPDLRRFDIGMMSMEGDHARKTLLQADYNQLQPKISPDGRWIAYISTESKKNEVYVRSFPDVNKGRWQVSTSGGDSPLWSPDGRELLYLNGDAVVAVSVKTEPNFDIVGTPQVLFRGTYVPSLPDNGTPWDISPDGKRFLMIKPPASTSAASTAVVARPKITIVLNWFEELKQRVPVK
jgi:serine/threonine protein kinase